jgi:hypothetical protein
VYFLKKRKSTCIHKKHRYTLDIKNKKNNFMKLVTFLLLGAFFLNACKTDQPFVDENPVILVSAVPVSPPKNEVNCELLRKQFRIPEGQKFNCDSLDKIVRMNGISF